MQKRNTSVKRNLRENKGITLIALIITIIVMLILVGVSIQIVVNSNLFNTAKSAGEQTEVKYEEEKTFGDNITINGKDYSNLNDYIGEIKLVGQSDGNGLKDYKIYGNSVQNGTPSPSTPVEIQSVGDKTINLCNKNNVEIGGIAGGTGGNYSNSKQIRTGYDEVEPLKEYYFYIDNSLMSTCTVFFYDENKTFISFMSINTYGGVFTTKENTRYIRVRINSASEEDYTSEEFENIKDRLRICLSSYKDQEYEPYGYKIPVTATNETGENVTTNIYLDEPLRKIGDYADFIDFKNGRVVRNISSVDLSTLSWIRRTNSADYYNGWNLDFMETYSNNQFPTVKPTLMSSYFFVCTRYDMYNKKATIPSISHYILNSNKTIGVYYPGFEEVTDFTEAIKGMEVYYVLPTPEIQNINLPTIKTLEGKNTITVQTQIQPSDMTAEF